MAELVPVERILGKIFLIRNTKVMLDRDLAELYGVETRVLKQAVRRNIKRFPKDFMFDLTYQELRDLTSQFVIKLGRRAASTYGFYRARGCHAFKRPKKRYRHTSEHPDH